MHIHEILVQIPEEVKSRHDYIVSWTGDKQRLDEPLPFWMIFSGHMWANSSLPQHDLQIIYRSFFRNQVIGAIERGDLPKPYAMVFSGGQEEHFHISEMLKDILEEQGIKSAAGLAGGSHCGVVRLSYPNTRVVCQLDGDGDVNPSLGVTAPIDTAESNRPNIDLHLPQIILAGVQKSGSTAVAYYLNKAGVCLSRPDPSQDKEKKEVHFFDRNSLYKKGVHYYSDLFAHCKDKKLITDATPENFVNARRIRETYDSVGQDTSALKIVIVVREPVVRELSWYNHIASYCYRGDQEHCNRFANKLLKTQIVNETSQVRFPTFTEYAETKYGELMKGKSLTSHTTSLYGNHLEEWLLYFERKQILVVSYSELKQNEPSFLQRVISFLDLDVDPALVQAGTKQRNKQDTPGTHNKVGLPACDIQERLSDAFMPSSDKFFSLLEQSEGPEMEQRPFPRFELSNCTAGETIPPTLAVEVKEEGLLFPASKATSNEASTRKA